MENPKGRQIIQRLYDLDDKMENSYLVVFRYLSCKMFVLDPKMINNYREISIENSNIIKQGLPPNLNTFLKENEQEYKSNHFDLIEIFDEIASYKSQIENYIYSIEIGTTIDNEGLLFHFEKCLEITADSNGYKLNIKKLQMAIEDCKENQTSPNTIFVKKNKGGAKPLEQRAVLNAHEQAKLFIALTEVKAIKPTSSDGIAKYLENLLQGNTDYLSRKISSSKEIPLDKKGKEKIIDLLNKTIEIIKKQ